ncbi:XrtA/PEP-CTERM system TPR-repeat protein PrsT [uncultured Paraglaciecola sp.]|uniref:XrtA/PEP-CTERM system TPR-repeat protein PrsT n=1 Tax=uncultured Paraglaciecola sp. TaxID=1765024 RepID=UPI0030D9FB08|tara:strand:+ start:2431 stop:5220 length:2790 start_codon:yes stop_codon:yes gene_type:complete
MTIKIPTLLLFIALSHSIVFANSLSDYEKALSAYQIQKYDEAFIHLKNSLQQDPNNLAAKILMGQLLLIEGYLSAAETEFFEALQQGADLNLIAEPLGNALLFQNKYLDILDLDFENKLVNEQKTKWLMIRASACIRLNKLDCAEKAYKDNLINDKNHLQSLNGLASIALFQDDYAIAETYIDKAMNITTEDATTWRQKGLLAQAKGNLDAAIDYMQQALTFKNDDPVTLRKLADLYLESNDFDSARIFINDVIEKTPDDPLAILLSSWLDSKEKSKPIDGKHLERLNEILAALGPDVIAAQPELLYISGLTAFFDGKLEQATRDFSSYLSKSPNDMQAVILLSRAYMATQQNKKALVLLEEHQTKLIENLDSALLLGELFINSNRSFKAQSLVNELEQVYGDEPRLQLFKIKLMMVRGKQQEALAILDANLNKNLNNPTFLFTYSMLQLQGNNKEKALKSANALITLYPNDPNFLNLKAGILVRLNQLDEAELLIEKALKSAPSLFPAKFNLASIYSRKRDLVRSDQLIEELLTLSPKHTQVLTLKAHNMSTKNEFESAIAIYNEITLLNPSDTYAKSQLSKIYFKMGNYEKALYHIERLLINNFTNAEFQLQKAQVLLKLDRTTELAELLLKISVLDDLSVESLIVLSNLQRATNNLSAAIASLSKAEKLAPNNSFISLDKAKLFIETEQFEESSKILTSLEPSEGENPNFWLVKALYANKLNSETNAVKYLQKALSLNPNFHQPLVLLYEMSLSNRQFEIFVNNANNVLKANPNNIFAKNLLAQFYYVQQDFVQASTLYKELLDAKTQINKAEIYNKLAIMSLDNDLQQSNEYIQQAFALNENNARILDTYGWVLSLLGNYEEGLGLLRKAFARDSYNPEIRYHIGYSLIKLGRLEEAKKELSIAVNVSRPFYNRAKTQELLDNLQ